MKLIFSERMEDYVISLVLTLFGIASLIVDKPSLIQSSFKREKSFVAEGNFLILAMSKN